MEAREWMGMGDGADWEVQDQGSSFRAFPATGQRAPGQCDIPVAGTLKLSLFLMMDQKASRLISEICRREGAGYILEPSVLHL